MKTIKIQPIVGKYTSPMDAIGNIYTKQVFHLVSDPKKRHLDNGISRSYPFFRMLLIPPGPDGPMARWPDDESEVDLKKNWLFFVKDGSKHIEV